MQQLLRFIVAAAAIMTCAAAPAGAQTQLIDTFRDWASYRHNGKPAEICFALAKPKEALPKKLKRTRVFFYVSAWPKDGVKTEISIKMGYAVKKDVAATIKIGPNTFKLMIEDDKAFVDDPTAELKLIEAMKQGASMVVRSQAGTGTKTKDTYSLRGVTKAIESLTRSCNNPS